MSCSSFPVRARLMFADLPPSRAAAIAFAEFDEAFNGDGAETAPRGGTGGNRFGGYPPKGPRGMGAGAGFVRAGGELHCRTVHSDVTHRGLDRRYGHTRVSATEADPYRAFQAWHVFETQISIA